MFDRLPLVAAPMFVISGPELVKACQDEQILGAFPALNQRTTQGLSEWLGQLDGRPFATNLIVHKTNQRLQADLEALVAAQAPVVITSLGAVNEVVDAVHSYGGKVYHDVISTRHATKALQAGVDGLIGVCAGAGGHAGTLNPFAFAAELRSMGAPFWLAGALNSGADILSAQLLGAQAAYMGTRFIATQECRASDGYKDAVVSVRASDIIYTDAVSGVHGNFIASSIANVQAKDSIDLGAELTSPEQGAKAWVDQWSAGQGVAGIDGVLSVKALIGQMEQEYQAAKAAIAAL